MLLIHFISTLPAFSQSFCEAILRAGFCLYLTYNLFDIVYQNGLFLQSVIDSSDKICRALRRA